MGISIGRGCENDIWLVEDDETEMERESDERCWSGLGSPKLEFEKVASIASIST